MEKLTESEEIVMKAVWDCEKTPVLSMVTERTTRDYGKDWRPQTVSTFLAKLVRKNYLQLCRNGKIYTYKTLITEAAYRRELYREHIRFWNHGNTVGLIKEMLDNGDISMKELEEIL